VYLAPGRARLGIGSMLCVQLFPILQAQHVHAVLGGIALRSAASFAARSCCASVACCRSERSNCRTHSVRMWIDIASGSIAAVALAPVIALPAYQRQGIGRQLIRSGLDSLRDCVERIVLVLGHPDYYQRFGFSTLKAGRLENPFPPGAFMAAELGPNALCDLSGKVRYAAAFGL